MTLVHTDSDYVTAEDVLRTAAEAYQSGDITWGVEFYHDKETGTRCALGAIGWVTGHHPIYHVAVRVLADYIAELTESEGELTCPTGVVSSYNDRPESTVEDIISVMYAAADRED